MKQYDITIIGGGMVGAALACALTPLSYRVALIDATPYNAATDHRLIALTYGSCNLLQNIDVWPLLATHATAIQQIHVSHRAHFGITRVHANELNLSTLGHLVPAKYINTALEEKLRHSSVDIIRPATLKTMEHRHDGLSGEFINLSIQTPDGTDHLQTRVLIGADGTHSTVRELLSIPTKIVDYQQTAIVTITELQRHHQHIAYERFLDKGAIAMLPLAENSCATIWTTDNSHAAHLLQLNDAEFLIQLQKQFGYRLGRFIKTHARYSYPLKMVLAEQYRQNNILLIGNAAHTLHPIASQGLNLALYEIAELIDYLKHQPELSLSNMSNQHSQQQNSIQLTHRLTWLFSTEMFFFDSIRQLGMLGLDACKQAKQFFMKKTMGRTGTVPYLLKEKDYYENQYIQH